MIALAREVHTLIRPLVADDRSEWLDLWRGYLKFYEALEVIGVADATFALVSESHGTAFGLIAESGSRSIGLAHIVIHASTWSRGPRACLQDLFVAPAARGRGVGGALIEAAAHAADEAGACQFYWMTQVTNAPARQLYDRVGHLTEFIKYERPLVADRT